MGYYWATFREMNNKYYRFDTRVYFDSVDEIKDNDICIGAVVGKNPGSAMPLDLALGIPTKINLSGDKLLPTLRNMFKKADPNLGGRQYVQVLNLFYLCNPDLGEAINDYRKERNGLQQIVCNKEQLRFNWLWFLWGGSNIHLNEMKERFRKVDAQKFFYLNNNDKQVHENFPEYDICAKHTQGMQHDLMVPFLQREVR